jgi:hypothetical protein
MSAKQSTQVVVQEQAVSAPVIEQPIVQPQDQSSFTNEVPQGNEPEMKSETAQSAVVHLVHADESKKQDLDLIARTNASAVAKQHSINQLFIDCAEEIATHTATVEDEQEAVEQVLTIKLLEAIKLGVDDKMLSGKTKPKGSAYIAFVSSLQATRKQLGKKELSDAVRDNYMSKIRKFVEKQGKAPLDLYNNIYNEQREQQKRIAAEKEAAEKAKQLAEAQAAAAKVTTSQSIKQPESASDSTAQVPTGNKAPKSK